MADETPLSGADVRAVAEECCDLLRASADRDWGVGVPDLDWTVAEVVAHAAEGCLWYAIDLAAAGDDLRSVEHRIDPEHPPTELIATLATYARVVSWVVDAAPATSRGYHPMGAADPPGFAAMACDELLIHTDDAARGLGVDLDPERSRCARVLHRLFPWAPTDADPWAALRWANGRAPLGDRPRLSGWGWQCAPLEEWDGEPRTGDGPT